MQDFSEKRDFYRMSVECAAKFRAVSEGTTGNAIVKDLSSGGMLLWTDCEVNPGAQLNVEVLPGKNITPPLHAVVSVIRCDPIDGESGASHSAACSIEKMLSAEEVGADFP
jgi:hypothetical protein